MKRKISMGRGISPPSPGVDSPFVRFMYTNIIIINMLARRVARMEGQKPKKNRGNPEAFG
jgi:hypothetical protein